MSAATVTALAIQCRDSGDVVSQSNFTCEDCYGSYWSPPATYCSTFQNTKYDCQQIYVWGTVTFAELTCFHSGGMGGNYCTTPIKYAASNQDYVIPAVVITGHSGGPASCGG
jgi:hypothetical protein